MADAKEMTRRTSYTPAINAPFAARSGSPLSLLLFFVFWYIGNALYNKYNTMALTAAGGKYGGLTMTVSTMQLGVCTMYALVLWLLRFNPIRICGLQAPEKVVLPAVTKSDLINTIPVGMCSAAAHSAGVFCLGADPLFGQIVKAGEPVLSAVVNTLMYKKPPSFWKALCLPVIVGGVAFASLKKGADGAYALSFDERALLFGMIGNSFAAVKGAENKKLMTTPGLKERMRGVGNQFALTEVLAFLVSLPVMILTEGHRWGDFVRLMQTNKDLQWGLFASGMTFYLYNELATYTIKATGAVTASVANTAKRVIVMVYMGLVTGKALTDEQKIGSAIAIGGVLVYSVIDDIIKKMSAKPSDKKEK